MRFKKWQFKKVAILMVLLLLLSLVAVACQGGEEESAAEPEAEEPAAETEPAEEEEAAAEEEAAEEEEMAEEEATEEEASQEEAAEEEMAEEEAEPVTITFWIYDSFDGEDAAIYDAIAGFESEHPNVTVDVVPTQYGSSSFRDKFITAAQAGAGPDVLMADIIWSPEFAAIQSALPIDEMMSEGKLDEFYPGPVTTLQYQGQTYGLPFYTNALAMFYNKDAFAEAGLPDPADGWTWEEFETAVEATTTEDGQYGFGVLAGWCASFEWFPFLWSNGGRVLNEDLTEAAFNTEAGVESAEFFLGILNSDNVPEAAKTWQSWDELAAAFTNEVVAMYPVGDWGIGAVEGMEPDFEWGVAPLPAAEEPASVVGGANLMINSNTENADAAYALIDYLTSDPVVFEMMDSYNRLSARRGTMDGQAIVRDDPRMQVFVEALEYARARPPIPNWTAVDWDCLQPAFCEVLLEGKDVETAMSEAEMCANEALAP